MNDVVPLAQLQRFAHVNAQLDDIPAAERMVVGILQQWGKQFHPDENVPAHAVVVGDDLVILTADHVGHTLEMAH